MEGVVESVDQIFAHVYILVVGVVADGDDFDFDICGEIGRWLQIYPILGYALIIERVRRKVFGHIERNDTVLAKRVSFSSRVKRSIRSHIHNFERFAIEVPDRHCGIY